MSNICNLFDRFVVYFLMTWGHYLIMFGYIGGRLGNIRCCFKQLFESWQKVANDFLKKWVRLVSSIEQIVEQMCLDLENVSFLYIWLEIREENQYWHTIVDIPIDPSWYILVPYAYVPTQQSLLVG